MIIGREEEEIDVEQYSPSPSHSSAHREVTLFDEATFGGLLTQEQADRLATTPTAKDQRLFEQSLIALKKKSPAKVTSQQSKQSSKRGRDSTPTTTGGKPLIQELHLGRHLLRPWYMAPFPAEYFEGPERGVLWMCEYCLKYMRCRATFARHVLKCAHRLPPGCEIYRKDDLSLFEINGRTNREYCQRLCLLAKMFLDHKTLYYDVESFLFYVLVEWRALMGGEREMMDRSQRSTFHEPSKEEAKASLPPRHTPMTYSLVGYFSKEKQNPFDYNLSCIMVLPHHQRRGYGLLLIDLSYLLTRREGKLGTPEKPLSDLGLLSYVRYWRTVIVNLLMELIEMGNEHVSLEGPTLPAIRPFVPLSPISLEIATRTGMTINDVLATLEYLGFLRYNTTKTSYCLAIDPEVVHRHRQSANLHPPLKADQQALRWVPYTSSR